MAVLSYYCNMKNADNQTNHDYITRLEQFKDLVSNKLYIDILKQAKAGDPDWLLDMISELDYITPLGTFFIDDFHGRLLRLGYKSSNFDTDALAKELYAKQNQNR
jgi:hypothetical protein